MSNVISILLFVIPLGVLIFSIIKMVIFTRRIRTDAPNAGKYIRARVKYIVFTAVSGQFLIMYSAIWYLGYAIVTSM